MPGSPPLDHVVPRGWDIVIAQPHINSQYKRGAGLPFSKINGKVFKTHWYSTTQLFSKPFIQFFIQHLWSWALINNFKNILQHLLCTRWTLPQETDGRARPTKSMFVPPRGLAASDRRKYPLQVENNILQCLISLTEELRKHLWGLPTLTQDYTACRKEIK